MIGTECAKWRRKDLGMAVLSEWRGRDTPRLVCHSSRNPERDSPLGWAGPSDQGLRNTLSVL